MKKIFLLSSLVAMLFAFGSCTNYLNVDEYFADTFREDSIFANKYNITRYYNGAVNLLPTEGRLWEYGSTPGITGSDEAVSVGRWNGGFLDVQYSGTFLTTNQITSSSMSGWTWDFNVWDPCYKIVRKCNVLLSNISAVPDMNSIEKMQFRSEVRFLRAYAYYWILRNQGPVILLGDEVLSSNEGSDYYSHYRSTMDECVEYICNEFTEAAEYMPEERSQNEIYAPTKGVALSLAARLRLTDASPLYNGGDAARRYFSNFKRSSDGEFYVSQSYDERKWAVAAAAAKKVIDMGRYELYTVAADDNTAQLPANVPTAPYPDGAGGIDPYRSYSEQFTGEAVVMTNKELIWGTTNGVNGSNSHIFPLTLGGSNAISVPQRMVDMYYMADGRDIHEASAEYPYNNRPYDNTCIVQADKVLSKNYTLKGGTYAAYDNREPRFYANIGFSNRLWTMSSTTVSGKHDVQVGYYRGANNGPQLSTNNVYCMTGYTAVKYVHPTDALSGENARTIQKTLPLIRYAEILLSYAEALNHLTRDWEIDGIHVSRDTEEIKKYFNRVRYRAGLPGLTDDQLASAETLDKVIQRERAIELFHEGHRFYDIRRWGIVDELEKEPLTGLNVNLGEWSGFYQPCIIQHSAIRERVWKDKMILLPISLNEVRKAPTIDQNPGWEK